MSTIKNTDGEDPFELNDPLSSQNGKNPFHVDDAYFDAFRSTLNMTIADLEELKTNAPLLSSIPKYNPFEVPSNYFDDLPTKVQQLVISGKSSFSIREWILQFVKPNFVLPVATVIVIAIAAIHFVTKQVTRPSADVTADLSVEEQLYLIDETILIDLLNTNTAEADLNPSSSEESITDYLIDNDVDDATLNVDI